MPREIHPKQPNGILSAETLITTIRLRLLDFFGDCVVQVYDSRGVCQKSVIVSQIAEDGRKFDEEKAWKLEEEFRKLGASRMEASLIVNHCW